MRFAGTACAVLLAALYLLWDPMSADLAAQTFRTRIAEDHGFAIYNPYWYGGHHLPGYSLLTPPLFALIGPQVAGALAAVLGTFSFERMVVVEFGSDSAQNSTTTPATRTAGVAAACWFAVAFTATCLVTGRLTFAVGAALALTAAWLAGSRRTALAVPTAALAGLASPVAAVLLALAMGVWATTGRHARRVAATVAVCTLLPASTLMLLFPAGGSFPFALTSLLPTLAACSILWLALPREQLLLRRGVLTIGMLVLISGVVTGPMGGNATRPATLLAGSIAILALWASEHRRRLIWLAPLLLYWQLYPAFDDWWQARDDPSTRASYYEPLKREFGRRTAGLPVRVEVPFTDNHWEAAHLPGGDLMLARGWERQLDRKVNAVFYDDVPLTHERYLEWIRRSAVSYVALPDAPLDYSAADEADLIRSEPRYLREVWRNANWRLFAVRDPVPLADGATVIAVAPDEITIAAPQRGSTIRFRRSRYFGDLDSRPDMVTKADPDGLTMYACTGRPGVTTLRARLRRIAQFDLRELLLGEEANSGCG